MLHVTFNLIKLTLKHLMFNSLLYLLTPGINLHLKILLSGMQILHDPQQQQRDLANNSVIIEGAFDALAFNIFLSRIM